jgi:hypothetical protein
MIDTRELTFAIAKHDIDDVHETLLTEVVPVGELSEFQVSPFVVT